MKNYLILFALTFSMYSFSQDFVQEEVRVIENALVDLNSRGQYEKYANAKGVPYVSEDFSQATILPNKKVYPVRYNAVDDELEVKLQDKIIVLDNTSGKNYKIVLDDNSLTYVSLYNPEKNGYGYFIPISDNNAINFYKKQVKKFYPAEEAKDNYSITKMPYFSDLKTVFYIEMNGNLQLLPKKRKAFIKLFNSDKQATVKKYISSNKIKLNKAEDLIKLSQFLNESL